MEEIRWIHSIDCRSCALEMRDAPRRKMEQIVDERKHTPKCRGCERLANVTNKGYKWLRKDEYDANIGFGKQKTV